MGQRRRMIKTLLGTAAAGAAFAALGLVAPASAEDPAESASANASPVLVELFLSQACNMCPPAAALFPSIAARPDVVALSWHIDYWNMTASEEHGRWIDPYSQAAFTARQKRYNVNIRNRSSIYTPQAIVDGAAQTVGANKEKIATLIAEAPRDHAEISASVKDGEIRFEIGKSEDGGNAYLVTFKKRVVTDVTGGKNAGKIFDEVNVVTRLERRGLVRQRGGEITAPLPANGEGCALIVQAPGQKDVIAAAYCPQS